MHTLDAITSRQSSRAYLSREVSQESIMKILSSARWAPSGANMQPWRVAVVRGESKQRLGNAIIKARHSNQTKEADYRYYPEQWFEPYTQRRKNTGLLLYSAQGIGLHDKQARQDAWDDNYHFFGAPVGLLVFLDHRLGQGSWMDIGMFLQNIMLAAQAEGLATCPEASVAEYPHIVRDILGIEHNWALACGIALGYADKDAAVNNYRTPREEVESFTSWHD
jgi:nitroreductase